MDKGRDRGAPAASPVLRASQQTCDRCGDASQYRAFLCHRCWRSLPQDLLDAWNGAATSAAKLAAADRISVFTRIEQEQLAWLGLRKSAAKAPDNA